MKKLIVVLLLGLALFGCSQNSDYVSQNSGTAGSPSPVPVGLVTGAVSGEITWSGYVWETKSYAYQVGPGPNYFSDSIDNLWVDKDGKLHLKITNKNGKWYCPELGTKQSFGYGTYRFYTSSRIDNLNENVVVGLFTWDDTSSDYYNREIDIEFARWGNMAWPNLNYTVQPYGVEGNVRSTDIKMTGNSSTHSFKWQSGSVFFQSVENPSKTMDSWTYSGSYVPPKGNEKVRINLWLMNGTPPSDNKEVEFIIDKFEFVGN